MMRHTLTLIAILLLLSACSNNNDENDLYLDSSALVTVLLDKGSSINHQEQTRGWTALIWAAKRGHTEVVRLLLEKNADKNITDHNGKTALSWAKESQKPEIVTLLQ